MDGGDGWRDLTSDRLDKIETKIDRLQAMMNWALGAGAVIGMLMGFFADKIRAFFGP